MSLNFISCSCILMREQLTLFLGDLEFQKCAHAQNKSFPICIIFKMTKISHSFFIEMKISFCMIYPNIP